MNDILKQKRILVINKTTDAEFYATAIMLDRKNMSGKIYSEDVNNIGNVLSIINLSNYDIISKKEAIGDNKEISVFWLNEDNEIIEEKELFNVIITRIDFDDNYIEILYDYTK